MTRKCPGLLNGMFAESYAGRDRTVRINRSAPHAAIRTDERDS